MAVTDLVDAEEKREMYALGLVENQETTHVLMKKAKERDIYIVFNTYECDTSLVPPILFNVSALVGSEGFVGKYHKIHMPGGETLLARPGSDYPVFETSIGKIGMLICFDFAFPEAHRCITLNGAEIIVISTAAPLTNLEDPEHDDGLDFLRAQIKASSYANNVNYVVSNNANLGALAHSMIFNANGKLLAETEGFDERLAVADLGIIKEEHVQARIFDNCGLNLLKTREPQTYGNICEPIR
jgi:predicted amidohydrolase